MLCSRERNVIGDFRHSPHTSVAKLKSPVSVFPEGRTLSFELHWTEIWKFVSRTLALPWQNFMFLIHTSAKRNATCLKVTTRRLALLVVSLVLIVRRHWTFQRASHVTILRSLPSCLLSPSNVWYWKYSALLDGIRNSRGNGPVKNCWVPLILVHKNPQEPE